VKRRPILLVAALLVATSSACLSDPVSRANRTALDDTRQTGQNWPNAAEPAPVIVEPGDTAPDFSYQAESGEWLRLHRLLEHGSVVLVFAPAESVLRELEGERDSLYKVGVIPVAVIDRRPGQAAALARHLNLGYPVLADPRSVIASQFNLLGPPTVRPRPAWFVVDRAGRVRALRRGVLPAGGYLRLACNALAIPSPGVPVPSSVR
jgi:peroxiredoxin